MVSESEVRLVPKGPQMWAQPLGPGSPASEMGQAIASDNEALRAALNALELEGVEAGCSGVSLESIRSVSILLCSRMPALMRLQLMGCRRTSPKDKPKR